MQGEGLTPGDQLQQGGLSWTSGNAEGHSWPLADVGQSCPCRSPQEGERDLDPGPISETHSPAVRPQARTQEASSETAFHQGHFMSLLFAQKMLGGKCVEKCRQPPGGARISVQLPSVGEEGLRTWTWSPWAFPEHFPGCFYHRGPQAIWMLPSAWAGRLLFYHGGNK